MVKAITSKPGSKDISSTSQPDEEERLPIELLGLLKAELNAIQRHILLLRYPENFSINETALIVGKIVNNIRAMQNRTLAKLNRQLNSVVGVSQQGSAFGVDP